MYIWCLKYQETGAFKSPRAIFKKIVNNCCFYCRAKWSQLFFDINNKDSSCLRYRLCVRSDPGASRGAFWQRQGGRVLGGEPALRRLHAGGAHSGGPRQQVRLQVKQLVQTRKRKYSGHFINTNEHFSRIACTQVSTNCSLRICFSSLMGCTYLVIQLNVNKVKIDPEQSSLSCWSSGSNVLKSVHTHIWPCCCYMDGWPLFIVVDFTNK